jgi:hypothetical protein
MSSNIHKDVIDRVVNLMYEEEVNTKLILSILLNEDNQDRVFSSKTLRRVVDSAVETDNYSVFLYVIGKYASNLKAEFIHSFLRASVNSCMLLHYLDNIENEEEVINSLDADGNTPLMIAGEENDSPDIFYILLKRGADISIENGDEEDIFQILSKEPVDNEEKLDILYLMKTKSFKESLPFISREVSDKYKDLEGLPKKLL